MRIAVQSIAAFVKRGDTPGLPFFSGITCAFLQLLTIHPRGDGDQVFTGKAFIKQDSGHRTRKGEGDMEVGKLRVHDDR